MIVIVPMAGRGSRFKDRGYEIPKPFIKVLGKPMFQWALESLSHSGLTDKVQRIILIALEEDALENNLREYLIESNILSEILTLPAVTEGQLVTVLTAENILRETDQEILIIPSDTIVKHGEFNNKEQVDGLISVIEQEGEQWSFARFDKEDFVLEVAEKNRISPFASTGWYYFKSSHLFCDLAKELIENKEKTKGEYYIMPLYQKYIELGFRLKVIFANEMIDLGTPEAKIKFENSRNS